MEPSDLDGFVEKVLKVGNDPALRLEMSKESRRMAEEATWESIGNRVAWKLAEALEAKNSAPEATENISSLSIPVYSWLLLSHGLRGLLLSLVTEARLVAGLGIIVGVWGGLIGTWVMVKVGLVVRTRAPWLSRMFGRSAA